MTRGELEPDRTRGWSLKVDDVPQATIHPLPSFKVFWESLRKGRLLIRRCSECGTLFSPARVSCPKCMSTAIAWKKSSAKGRVYSFSTIYAAFGEELDRMYMKNELPSTLVLVELDEGVFFLSNLIDCPPAKVRVGLKVRMDFKAIRLPKQIPRLSKLRLPPMRPDR